MQAEDQRILSGQSQILWQAIVNPNAGTHKGRRDWPLINRLLLKKKILFEVFLTGGPLDAERIVAERIAAGATHFLVIGGDGTLNEVINGIFKTIRSSADEIVLAMIPVGTGNDWCRTFKIPFSYREAIELLSNGQPLSQDVGVVSYHEGSSVVTRFFVNVTGIGYDAVVAQKVNRSKQKGVGGPLMYLYMLLTSLFEYRINPIVLKADGNQISGKIFSISVGIGKYNGGGIMQLPEAIPDDGLLNVTIIGAVSKWTVIGQLKNLYNGTFVKHKAIKTLVAKEVEINAVPPLAVESDGESLGQTPLKITIHSQKLNVIAGTKFTAFND